MTIKSFLNFLEEENYTQAKETFESVLAEKISTKLEVKKVEFGKKVSKENLEKGSTDPCWDGYVQVGTKKKNGRDVPNCVPREETEK